MIPALATLLLIGWLFAVNRVYRSVRRSRAWDHQSKVWFK